MTSVRRNPLSAASAPPASRADAAAAGGRESGAVRAIPADTLPAAVRAVYPFSPHVVRTPQGAELSFVDAGPSSEHAVVLLHGNPSWSFLYRDLIRELVDRGRRCIAPDHIGMGLSAKPADYPYDLATRVADITHLIATLSLRSVDLVVHDWGGAIGMGWAADPAHAAMVRRCVVLNTGAFPSTHITRRIALCRTRWPGTWIVRALNGFAWPATWMAVRRRLPRAVKEGFLFPYGSWADRVAVDAFVKDIPLDDRHPSMAALRRSAAGVEALAGKPARIVWGGRDFCFDDTFLAEWQQRWPQATVHRAADAGHYVLEDLGPEGVRDIASWLAERD